MFIGTFQVDFIIAQLKVKETMAKTCALPI